MNQDDIVRMARECGLTINDQPMLGIERFAALVAAAERETVNAAVEQLNRLSDKYRQQGDIFGDSIRTAVAAEREACARVCEGDGVRQVTGDECAAAIRARGES